MNLKKIQFLFFAIQLKYYHLISVEMKVIMFFFQKEKKCHNNFKYELQVNRKLFLLLF